MMIIAFCFEILKNKLTSNREEHNGGQQQMSNNKTHLRYGLVSWEAETKTGGVVFKRLCDAVARES